jgi:hypothetical protein
VKLFAHAPVALRRTVAERQCIEIRRANGDDVEALRTLADLTEGPVPPAPLLVAEVDGALLAAMSTRTGEIMADPFVPTEDVVALLRFRVSQLDAAA